MAEAASTLLILSTLKQAGEKKRKKKVFIMVRIG